MARNRIIYILLALVCIAFSMIYMSKITAIIMFVVLSYPIIAAVFTAVQLIFVKASFENSRVVSEKNSPFEYYINISNGIFLPCSPLEMICRMPDLDGGLFCEKRVYVSLPPLGKARLAIEGKHLYRGCYSCVIERISVVDPLRIVKISKRPNNEMSMVFVPRRLALEDVVSDSVGEQTFTRPNPVTFEKEDFSHVRDYREGDVMQMVHWKLTAKADQLMIKHYDSINDRCALVLCDWSGIDADVLLKTDTIIETALAFVRAALDTGIYAAVDLGRSAGGDIIRISSEGEFENFFELMSVLPIETEKIDFSAAIDATDKSTAAMIVLITANLTDEVVRRARAIAEHCAVYLAYINLSQRPVDGSLFEEEFLFFNIRGSGEEALKLAAAMASRDDN